MNSNKRTDPLAAGQALISDGARSHDSAAPFSQRDLRELSFELSARWFSRELSPRLTLSVVHPWRIHAYWYVTPAMMNEALATTTAPQVLVIRFFDLTPGQTGRSAEQTRFDIEVDGLDNNWYVDLWQPGRRYVAELGLRGADNALHVLVRSNEIQMPRAEPSPALAFNLARYQGAKPISEAEGATGSAFSVSRLTGLLPPFSGFRSSQPDAVDQTFGERGFPGAPLERVQNWDDGPTMDVGASKGREPSGTGKEFPAVSIDTVNKDIVDMAGSDSPIDYAVIPELPAIDPLTVSESGTAFASVPPPWGLDPENSGTSSAGSAALTTTPDNKRAVAHDRPAGRAENLAPAAAADPSTTERQVPGGPAPTPVVPLEEAIAETAFSATTDDKALDLSVQLELSGVAGVDQVLTVLGEPVQVDAQGRYSVRIKLDRGPHLAALLRAQRRVVPEHH